VGHDRGVLDQALHAAEALGQGEDAAALQNAPGAFEVAIEDGGDHAAEAAHLAFRQLVLRVARQARVDHLRDVLPGLQPAGDGETVLAVAFHS
jgi:hypothetical protein